MYYKYLMWWNIPFNLAFCLLLQGLIRMSDVLPTIDDDLELGLQIARRVWVVSYDDDDNIRQLADM
jgi:hypothetical protein